MRKSIAGLTFLYVTGTISDAESYEDCMEAVMLEIPELETEAMYHRKV